MKKRFLALLLTGALLLSGCGGPSYQATELTANRAAASPPAADLSGPGAQAAADFAVRLFLETDGGEGNLLLSPISVLMALAMTANGASGETRSQMEAVLGMPSADWNAYLGAYLDALPLEKTAACQLANSVWFRDDGQLTVREDFLAAAADSYRAAVYSAPFNDGTLRDINAWVSDHTGGLIPSILDQISSEAAIYLINALAFDGMWEAPYQSGQLHPGIFTAADGSRQGADMMYSGEDVFLDDGRATGFLKYYEGRSYAFAALLPNEGVSLDDYLDGLTGESLRATLAGAREEPVEAGLPQFTCESTLELREALTALGMPDAFDPRTADFSAMGGTPGGPLYLSRVLHRTFLAVDAEGTRAGAVTAVEVDAGEAAPPSREVILDRPFVYLLLDCKTQLPLFLGVVRSLDGV